MAKFAVWCAAAPPILYQGGIRKSRLRDIAQFGSLGGLIPIGVALVVLAELLGESRAVSYAVLTILHLVLGAARLGWERAGVNYRVDQRGLAVARRFGHDFAVPAARITRMEHSPGFRRRLAPFATRIPDLTGTKGGFRIDRGEDFPLFIDPEDPERFAEAIDRIRNPQPTIAVPPAVRSSSPSQG